MSRLKPQPPRLSRASTKKPGQRLASSRRAPRALTSEYYRDTWEVVPCLTHVWTHLGATPELHTTASCHPSQKSTQQPHASCDCSARSSAVSGRAAPRSPSASRCSTTLGNAKKEGLAELELQLSTRVRQSLLLPESSAMSRCVSWLGACEPDRLTLACSLVNASVSAAVSHAPCRHAYTV